MWHTWRGDSGYIPGLSLDGHGYSGIRGYSDKGGGGEGWTSLDYPWMVTVTLASADTLTTGGEGGRVDIPGLSMDGHGYSGIRGYSDKGGGEGWTSLDYPWMVTVTLASADTLTRGGGGGGRVDIPGLSMDGHSYSGIRGYSDKGGGGGGRRVDIPGLYMDGHCYSGVRGYSDMGGEGGHPWTIHGWSQLLPAKYKATVSIHGWQRIVYGTIGHIVPVNVR